METIFHHDPRIEEWVNQITEKIFIVCLLSGLDSEVEFQKGSLTVTKIASVLLSISTFPSEYLKDGLRQLLEQQLPDERVINNFPTFRAIMNRMLQEGISMVKESHQKADENIREEATEEAAEEVTEVVAENNPEEDGEEVIITKDSSVGEFKVTLKYVLSFTFPNKKVTWNSKLMGQTFLAQVDDTLIWLQDPYQPFNLQFFIQEGWKVVLCTAEDLKFRRRLERKIRQSQRLGKRS